MLHVWRMRKHMDSLAGMHLAWLFLGEMECSIAVSCFLFRVAESCSIFILFPRCSGFPNSSFATWELTSSCTPRVVSLFPRRWKCQDTPPFIFHQNKSEQDLYLGWFSSLKVIEGPMDVTSWPHLRSEPSALSLVAGKFCQPAPWVGLS